MEGLQAAERQTGWSIKKFVRTTRRYRTVQIQAGRQTLTAYSTTSAKFSPRSTPTTHTRRIRVRLLPSQVCDVRAEAPANSGSSPLTVHRSDI
jgi:hypothetical protein